MKYLSVKDFASKYGVSERTIRNYCVSGKIDGAFLTGKTWNIPEDATLPQKGKHSVKETPLVHALRFEKENKNVQCCNCWWWPCWYFYCSRISKIKT